MRLHILLGIAFVVFAATAGTSTAQNNLPDDVRAMAKKVMMPVVLKVPGMDRVKVVENLKYTKSDDPNVLMDIYVPPDLSENEKRPAVIFLHGGAETDYTPKDWGVYTSWGRLTAASGFVGVTFTHRLEYPNASLEKAAADVRDAIKYVRENADKYQVDKDRVCLIAYSAGGPVNSGDARRHAIRALSGWLLRLYGHPAIGLPKDREAGDGEIFSPITYLQTDANKIPPMFIARAGHDEVPTMLDSIDRFINEALARNIALSFANHPEGVHGFDNQNNDDRSREIIRTAIEFIRLHLGKKI
jgi:acetyl esterase/lipase